MPERSDLQIYASAAAIGAVAGMRAMSAPALVSRIGSSSLESSRLSVLTKPSISKATMLLAGAELIADKLPGMPNRTMAPALITRAISGALCGAAICSAARKNLVWGAVAGALGAVGATYAAFELRRGAKERFGIPDPVLAIAEDALALSAGRAVTQLVQTV